MSILGFYLARRVGGALALVWLALGTLLGIFEFLEEAGGRSPGESAALALLGLPRLLMETLPFACAIGAAVAAALLERRREIPAMRAAGLSPAKLAALCGAAALPFCAAFLVLSEAALSPGESVARSLKNPAGAAQAAARDLWVRDGADYARIGAVGRDGDRLADVAVYRARGNQLDSVLAAKSAEFADGEWILRAGWRVTLGAEKVGRAEFSTRTWQTRLSPSALSALTVRPREMSLAELRRAVAEADGTGQNSADFSAEFWGRLAALLALPLLAACGVFFLGRGGGPRGGRHAETAALLGALLAGGFFAAATAAERLSALGDFPFLALLPTAVLGAGAWFWARRTGESG